MSKLSNEPAFAHSATVISKAGARMRVIGGLTKREYFAAKAMQGAMVGADIDSLSVEGAAFVAVKLADALIAELEKEKE